MATSFFQTPASSDPSQPTVSGTTTFIGNEGTLGAPSSHPLSGTMPTFEGFESGQSNHPQTGTAQSHSLPLQTASFQEWPDPQPLQSNLQSVAPLSPNHLPKALVPFVSDISDRMQCPPDYVAAALVTALGSIIGTRLAIRPKRFDDWQVIPNLWCMNVGRPGAMKTPAVGEAIGPLRKLEAEARIAFDNEAHARTSEAEIYKARKRACDDLLKRQLAKDPNAQVRIEFPVEPSAALARRFIVNDATYEALGDIASRNTNGILAYRDELMSLLRTLDREEYVAARGFYLTGWDGKESYTFDRITRTQTHIDPVCLSLLGSTQPGRLIPYVGRVLKGGDSDDGLIQRFSLLVWPDQNTSWSYVDRKHDTAARNSIEAMFRWIASNDLAYFRPQYDANGRGYLTYSEEGSHDFIEWLHNLEHRLRNDDLHPCLESHLAKYRKLVPALSLIYHIADSGVGPVTRDATQRAIAYSKYLETHARRAYSAGAAMGDTAAALIAKKLSKGALPANFTLRDIHQKSWSGLTDRELIQSGLDKLCESDWLQSSIVATGGRSKVIYATNPKALAQ